VRVVTALERVQSLGLRVHQWLYERSDGRVGHRLGGLSTLLLRTTGRRTGRTRVAALVYVTDGPDRYVVVGSNGGADRAPGWVHNLRAEARAEVQVGRRRISVRAYEAEGPERVRLWIRANERNRAGGRGRYDVYQDRTQRMIPVFVLEAEPPPSP
jgi:deazaflavin-dependent oxidoreductase (nitroreductase family)